MDNEPKFVIPMKTTLQPSFILVIVAFMYMASGCSQKPEFTKDCDLCGKVSQKEVAYCLNDFVYNDITNHISTEAQTELLKEKETLRHGHKFIECGCRNDIVVYHLWCANNETFDLEVTPLDSNQFTITGFRASEFAHP